MMRGNEEAQSNARACLAAFVFLTGVLVVLFLLEACNTAWAFNYNVLSMLKGELGRAGLILSFSASFLFSAIIVLCFMGIDMITRKEISGLTCRLVFALALSMVLASVFKALLEIPRPSGTCLRAGFPQSLLNADMYAFPSGHAARAAVISWFLVRRSKVFIIIAPVYVLAVCFSRVALAAHWPMDVITGVVLGIWCSLAIELVGCKVDKACRIVCDKVLKHGARR